MIPLLLILLVAKITIAQDNIGKSQLGLQPSLNSPEYVNNTVFEYNYHDHGQVPISSYIHQYISKLKPMPNILKAWTGSSTYNDQVESQFYPGEILDQQPLGLGPRRRKRSALNAPKIITKAIEHLLEMPLFCWKIYVNCLVFPNHICCPIQKKKPRRTRRNFDIPMSVPKEDLTRRSDEYQTSLEFQRQEWKPYSPYYIGLQGYKKPTENPVLVRRCLTTDMSVCRKYPQNPCCSQFMVNRFYPIRPYVQPTLTENWMSAFLDFAGKNPVEFIWIKSLVITVGVVLLTMAWGALGMLAGVVPPSNPKQTSKPRKRNDNIEETVIRIERDLMKSLQEYGSKSFTCCMSKDNFMHCLPKTKENKFKPDIKNMDCLYDGYDVMLNSNAEELSNDINNDFEMYIPK